MPNRIRGYAWNWTLGPGTTIGNIWTKTDLCYLLYNIYTASNSDSFGEVITCVDYASDYCRFLWQ